jgi:hypothetical protein
VDAYFSKDVDKKDVDKNVAVNSISILLVSWTSASVQTLAVRKPADESAVPSKTDLWIHAIFGMMEFSRLIGVYSN